MFVGNRSSGWKSHGGNNASDNVTQCERRAQYACKSGKFSLHEIRAGMHPNPICCYLLTGSVRQLMHISSIQYVSSLVNPQATG